MFIAAVPPFLHLVDGNPDGGLDDATLQALLDGVRDDRPAFVDDFLKSFFSANAELQVSEAQRQYARSMAEAVTGAQLHVIKGGPHGVTASHAKELNQVLLAFLAT